MAALYRADCKLAHWKQPGVTSEPRYLITEQDKIDWVKAQEERADNHRFKLVWVMHKWDGLKYNPV